MALADVHAHLTHPRLAGDADQVVARAVAAGVTTIVTNGLNPADNAAALALAARHTAVRPALGLYPVDAVLPELRALGADYPREGDASSGDEGIAWLEAHVDEAFAVGEIGLDGHWVPESLWARQEELFRRALEIARAADKAVIIHTRRRERRALEILREAGVTRVDWHCFGGKVRLAREVAEAGHYLSIPANARRSESFTRMLETLPRDRILFETDCPYLGPDRDRTNEPATVAGTADYTAELWGVSRAEVEAQLAENFTRLFRSAP
jgi:TatD DNase family protein